MVFKFKFLSILYLMLSCLFFLGCDYLIQGEDIVIEKKQTDTEGKEEIEEIKNTEVIQDENDERNEEMEEMEVEKKPSLDEREWSILVYMSADNNLESAAIADLIEMEKSKLNTKNVSVLVLLDRNPSYDSSNGNWKNTKLYRLKPNNVSDTNEILSEEIECLELGLSSSSQNELDMSAYMSLSRSIKFMYENYPANQYGVILWGHGEGWRGFCYDETSEKRMTLTQLNSGLKNGLNGKKLDFIGFDSCFGAELEVFYQVRNYADVAFGVEGLLGINGMDYELLFNSFTSKKQKSLDAFIDSVVMQFQCSYEKYSKAAISVVDLNKIENYFLSFDSFSEYVASKINTNEIRDEIQNCILTKVNQFFYEEKDSDLHIDIDSFVNELSACSVKSEELEILKAEYFNARNEAIIQYWDSDEQDGSLGVYFSTLTVGNYLQARHEDRYIKGAVDNQIDFVCDSKGYVPTVGKNQSLLDKLFYFNW